MQLSGDPGSFLGGGQAPFPFGLALSAQGTLLQFGDSCPAQPGAVSCDPRANQAQYPEQQPGDQIVDAVPAAGEVAAIASGTNAAPSSKGIRYWPDRCSSATTATV